MRSASATDRRRRRVSICLPRRRATGRRISSPARANGHSMRSRAEGQAPVRDRLHRRVAWRKSSAAIEARIRRQSDGRTELSRDERGAVACETDWQKKAAQKGGQGREVYRAALRSASQPALQNFNMAASPRPRQGCRLSAGSSEGRSAGFRRRGRIRQLRALPPRGVRKRIPRAGHVFCCRASALR